MQMKSKRTIPTGRSKRNQRESGEPGGGQGRRDVARGSGVYPMSGPLPRGNPVLRTEAAWGQGERGAAGYKDSGRSGLSVGVGAGRTSSARTKARRQPSSRQAESETISEIPKANWSKFFNDFSRKHEGWIAEIEASQRGSRKRVEARRLPFEGITVDLKPRAQNTTAIILEMQANTHLTHMLPNTKQVHFKEQPTEIHITAANGDKTIVHFQQPARSPKLLPPPRRVKLPAGRA